MPTRLYVIPISNPAAAGAAMMAHKRIPHRLVRLMPGLHPLLLRLAGFEGFTVPALELDGRKLQGSRTIARFLDEVRPDPPCSRSIPSGVRGSRRLSAGASSCSSPCRAGCFAICCSRTSRRGSGWAPR